MATNDKRPQRVERWEEGVLTSSCAAAIGDRVLETWGDEQPGIAITDDKSLDRVWLRFEDRSQVEWTKIVQGMRGEEPAEFDAEALLRKGTALDKRRDVRVMVGRSTDGGILVSMKPHHGDVNDGFSITLDRDDAHRFANAMEIADHTQRRAYTAKVESLRQHQHVNPMEVVNVHER